jgi:hypothetical protein
MAFSKIVLTFTGWDSGDPVADGVVIVFQVDAVNKNEVVVLTRSTSGQVSWIAGDAGMAQSYVNAWTADYAGTNFILSRVGNVVTITATYDGAVFSAFSAASRVSAVITNEAPPADFTITGAVVETADSNKCTTVKVTLTQENGTPPFTWNTVLPGNVGLIGANVPRSGNNISIEVEDSLGATSTIVVSVPETVDNTDIDAINIEGDPSGLFGTVTILMEAIEGLAITFEYSLDGATYQTSNIFTSVLPGSYTLYVRDSFGCVISQAFDVTLAAIRPPVFRQIPKSNSFGWMERQAAINHCTNPYNGSNAMPNEYKPKRWYNPKYFQQWCAFDLPRTQFRSNYDTLSAEIFRIIDGVSMGLQTITKRSNNLGQRQNIDSKIYQHGATQTAIYWTSGNTYENDLSTVNGSHNLDGQLPEWVKVGQKFQITGSAVDGIYEIVQVIYDSTLLVNAAIIDRIYTDVAEEVDVIASAVYNKLNYEVYEFDADLSALTPDCYKIVLSMTDSLAEYPDSIWDSFTFAVVPADEDIILIEAWDHIDDGILYSTGIVHKQRFTGLFYEENYPSNFETSRDSRKALNKNDGRVQKSFVVEAIDIQNWVHEKLALFISKKRIRINGIEVQFEEPFEKEKQPGYTRVNLVGEAFVKGYEQYVTNSYDIL